LPGVTPVSRPVVKPIDAMPGILLVHVPPPATSDSVTDKPVHTMGVPLMGSNGLTVNTSVTGVQLELVYIIVVVPPLMPLTTPPAVIVATPGMLLLQAPPATRSLSVTVKPWHTWGVPRIADGAGLTVTGVVA
jgi:hypothetical protein